MKKALVFLALTLLTQVASADGFTIKIKLGIARVFVDPDVNLPLSGGLFEITGEREGDSVSYGIALHCFSVLRGEIDAKLFSLVFGAKYAILRGETSLHFSSYIGPSWLLSGRKSESSTGYLLETGFRPMLRYGLEMERELGERLTISPSLQYHFTVKRVYLHNPFLPHKHEDIFHYLSLNIGLGIK